MREDREKVLTARVWTHVIMIEREHQAAGLKSLVDAYSIPQSAD
jgi:hypothetical protein